MNNVFDGLPEIFTETFGEAVEYTSMPSGDKKVIMAIWWRVSLDVSLDAGVDVDTCKTELSLRAADISEPREGDIVKRLSDGRVMTISTPILPDGKGVIVCNLTG